MEPTLPLFDEEPARPLADRLRPTWLEDVVGQDHLLAPDAPLGLMVAQQRLGSAILWGPAQPARGRRDVRAVPRCGCRSYPRVRGDSSAAHLRRAELRGCRPSCGHA
ncbi:hypothetical protein [Streptomyces phaeochromogenes]|uniref:hypothetical protein n=1 Tax=Streptomyces phaeochromogenes TaxID=1923 RepID=UPI000A4BAFD4|nr:hypothetical protein [Streptomyces phaeochromogenes]